MKVMLAKTYDGQELNSNWLVSMKLDGVRAFYLPDRIGQVGERANKSVVSQGLYSRLKKPTVWPSDMELLKELNFLYKKFPDLHTLGLDGELWSPDLKFQHINSIVSKSVDLDFKKHQFETYKLKYMIFDNPGRPGYFNVELLKRIQEIITKNHLKHLIVLEQEPVTKSAYEYLEEYEKYTPNYEGVMFRLIHSYYEDARTKNLLKFKKLNRGVGKLIGFTIGLGKYSKSVGAYEIEYTNEEGRTVTFYLSGMSDELREIPLVQSKIGRNVKFTFRDLTNDGKPKEGRFHSFIT